MSASRRLSLLVFTVSESLMVLPAAVLLAAGALRLLQPRIYEPARTSWLLYEWTSHMPHLWAGMLFIGLPGFATIAGSLVLHRIWRQDHELQREIVAAMDILRRHAVVLLLGAAITLSGAIVTAVATHILTD